MKKIKITRIDATNKRFECIFDGIPSVLMPNNYKAQIHKNDLVIKDELTGKVETFTCKSVSVRATDSEEFQTFYTAIELDAYLFDIGFFFLDENGDVTNNSYSTDETLTGGTWIDGKPIYRKVLDGSISNTGNFSFDLTTLNIQTLITKTGSIVNYVALQGEIGFDEIKAVDIDSVVNHNGVFSAFTSTYLYNTKTLEIKNSKLVDNTAHLQFYLRFVIVEYTKMPD
jgi:hypothetical protein